MDYALLPTNPNSSLGDPSLGTLGVSVSLRDVPRPTGPEEEAVFVLVSILDHSDTRVIIGSTEMRHIAGPHLDFVCTVGFHRVLPLDSTADPRKLLFEVFVATKELLPGGGEPLAPCRLREGSTGVKRVALHITPLFTSLYHGVVSYGLLDSDHPHQGLFSPLRAPLAEHTAEGADAPLPLESKPLGYIQTTALPLTPLAYTLGMVQLKCAFKGFPVRPSGRPSTPYLQVQRKVGQKGDVYVTEPAWCGIPKRSGGRRDPATPPPPGTPPFISDPVTLEIPIVALLEAGSGGMGVRSLRDVRSSITAMVRLEVCDWYGEEESGGGGGGGGGKDPSFGTLDVRLSELLDPALTSPYLDAVLHREGGGDGPELVVRFFDTVLVPLYNPFPSLLPLPPAPPTPVAPPTQVIKGSGMPGESLQYHHQQQQQQQGEGGYAGGVMGVGELAPPLPPPTISSAPTSLPPTKPTLLVPPPLLPPPTDSQREGVEEQVKLKLKEQESHIAGLLEQERQQQKVWQQQQEEQQSALRRAILEQQQLLQQQQQQLLQQQQQLLQASNPSSSYGGPSAAATMAYMLAPSYANVTASLQNMPSIASLPPPPPPPASYFASIGSTASSTSAIAAAAAAAAGSGAGAGTSGGTTYRERSTRIHVPPQHPSDTVFISPALLSVSPAITQRLQPGKGSSEQQETINSFIRSSHTAGAQWGGGSESSRVVSTSTPFSSPTPFPSSRAGGGGGGGGGGGAVATHLGNVTPSSLSSALGVVGSGATSSSSSSSSSSKLSLLDASTILPPPPPAAPLVSPLKLPPPTQLDWGSASKLAQSSITLGATLPSGGGGGGSVEILMPPLPLPKSLERGDDSISSGAERRLEALKKGTHTSYPPTPGTAATSSTTLLPSSSFFTLPKTAALAQTDFNAKLFTALLKNSDAAAAAAATAAVTSSQGGPKNPDSSSSSSLPGDWVVQYMQNLESGALGLAKRPPRDLVVSAAVSLGLTGVLESLEGIVHTTLANDRVVVSEAGAEAQLQRDSELRTAAGRGREAWWKAATAHEWPTSQAPPPPRGGGGGGAQPLHLSSTSGGPLTPLADTSVDDVPLSTYHYLKDAAARALGEITTRWPQAAMEAVRAPQDLRDFLRAAATPMSHSREASQSARATALREYDALHAEGLHQGTRRGEAVGAVGVVLGEGEELRREVREKRDTLATALDRVRGLLKEHALGVAEMEGVVWAGEDGHLLLNSPSSSSSDSTTGALTTPPLSSRIATTGELIALASAPNDASVGKARRLEAAKERVKAHTIAAPVDMYRDLLAATREETERRVRVMGEEAESRYALEIASADTVYRAGQRDAVEVAKASASKAAKAFSESGGGGADVLEAMSRRVVGVMSNSSSSSSGGGTARMGHREALETLVWEVEKSRVAQRELGERLQQVQAAITRLHVRQSCSMELTNLKHHCRAYWQNPHTHGIAHPLGIQRFLLQAVKISPYSSLMASFLRARHPPLADRYAQSPHVSMAGHLQNSSPYLSTYPPGAGAGGSGGVGGGDPYYAPNAWRPPSAPTPNPPFVNYATPLNPPPGFQNFSRAFGV